MCECFQIGGRFIAEDPDCPIHGTVAQREQRESEMEDARDSDRRRVVRTALHEALKSHDRMVLQRAALDALAYLDSLS